MLADYPSAKPKFPDIHPSPSATDFTYPKVIGWGWFDPR